jgi:hypothetical protein
MTKTRNLSDLLDANGKVDNTDILNVDAAKITTGTLDAGRIDNASLANVTALPFSAGTDWQSTIVTGTTLTAEAGKGYWINTTSNACTITLPSSASVGDFIEFVDYSRTWGTNAVTINRNGLNYQGGTENPVYDTNSQSVRIVYSGSTQGWIPTSDDDVVNEGTSPPYSADFLVIAGGGSGAASGGGAGAGGYRASFNSETSGGGGSSEASLTFNSGTVYTITIGAGGALVSGENQGLDGNNSVISGSDITTITSIAGGGGGRDGVNSGAGRSGGSGSGAGGGGATGGVAGSGTANQGFNGGTANNQAPNYGSGGGGGAGAVGANGTSSTGGNGGNGVASTITGSSITRTGGGGGASYGEGGAGTGGSGGGGNANSAGNATAGTVNTGSGGGGSYSGNSGAGGSGVVILRMLTSKYSGTTSGSPTVSTDGTDTILIYNASGSYTA